MVCSKVFEFDERAGVGRGVWALKGYFLFLFMDSRRSRAAFRKGGVSPYPCDTGPG